MTHNFQIISYKAKKILAFVFFIHCLFFLRLWHLSVIQKEEKKIESLRPQRKTLITKAQRGVITDRFGKFLVLNRIRYNAVIYYREIAALPTTAWNKDKNGKKIKYFPRKNYIEILSKKLEAELGLQAEMIEDLIHSKASLFPSQPFMIQENISERAYFRIRMFEKDWPGLHAEISSERFYPQKHVASKIIGYLGAINQNEYLEIAEEIKKLENFLEKTSNHEMPSLPEGYHSFHELVSRLKNLKEKAYSYQDLIGKSGIEAQFEEDLRGIYGKQTYAIDIKGNFLKKLPGSKDAVNGKNIQLSISSELQDFAEKLLAENESIRDGKNVGYDPSEGKITQQKQPWIKGGAIVAIDPNTHEIVALASHPNFDPNDFIFSANTQIRSQKLQNVLKWLETKQYIANIWDGKTQLTRKRYNSKMKKYIDQQVPLTWESYLNFILPKNSEIKKSLNKPFNVKRAIQVQEDVEALCYFFNTHDVPSLFDFIFQSNEGHVLSQTQVPLILKEQFLVRQKKYASDIFPICKRLSSFCKNIPYNLDKLLAIDLCKLAVFGPAFSDVLIEKIGDLSLANYYQHTKDALAILDETKRLVFKQFESSEFKKWRQECFKAYLKEKRKQEKQIKSYARPYTDYLEEKKRLMFQDFWKQHSSTFFLSLTKNTSLLEKKESPDYNLEKIKELLEPFFTKKQTFLHFLNNLPDFVIDDFLKTVRDFNKLNRPLFVKYRHIQSKKPLEKHLASLFHQPEGYGYMRSVAFQDHALLGSIFKLVTAYQALKENYKKNSCSLNPLTMIDAFKKGQWVQGKKTDIVGYGLNQKPYPRIYKKGRLPRSYHPSIGKIDLISAIERTSNPYFSILAGEYIQNPEDLNVAAKNFGFGKKTGLDLPGEIRGKLPKDLKTNRTGLYSYAIGQHTLVVTPLQTACFLEGLANYGKITKPKIVRHISGKEAEKLPFGNQSHFPFKEELEALGIYFPILLFDDLTKQSSTLTSKTPTKIHNQVFLPLSIRNTLLQGMAQVINSNKGTARISSIKSLYGNPLLKNQYKDLSNQVVGKTSTAEIIYNPYIVPSLKGQLYKHVWFGGICFENSLSSLEESNFTKPELIVVVYLKFGDWGKEAAPLAMQVMQKYREIKSKNRVSLLPKTKPDQNIQL